MIKTDRLGDTKVAEVMQQHGAWPSRIIMDERLTDWL